MRAQSSSAEGPSAGDPIRRTSILFFFLTQFLKGDRMTHRSWFAMFGAACLAIMTCATSGEAAGNIGGAEAADDAHSISALFGPPGVPRILYAPSNADDAALRGGLAAASGGIVDYFNAGADTPTLGLLDTYDVVIVWVNFSFADATLFGDRLATFVDRGGRVILGAFCTYTSGNSLAGRIMEPAYSPVVSPMGTNLFLDGTFASGGKTCAHNCVETYTAQFRDELITQGLGEVDSRYDDFEIGVAYRLDRRVWYFNGFSDTATLSGDWPQMVANIIDCGQSQRVLIFDDTQQSTLLTAAQSVGYGVRIATDGPDFASLLAIGDFDAVVVSSSLNGMPTEIPDLVETFVAGGGRAILSYWDLDGSLDPAISESLRDTFDVASTDTISDAFEVFPWIDEHPIYRNPSFVGDLLVDNQGLGDNGDRLVPSSGATAVGGFTGAPAFGEAAIVVGNQGRTIVNGFMYDNMDPVTSARLAENQMRFLYSRSRVLILDNSTYHGIAVRAAERSGLTTTVALLEGELREELESGSDWELVIIDAPSTLISDETQEAIVDYVDDGGSVLLSYWDLDSSAFLPSAFGISSLTDFFDPMPVQTWVGGHPIFNTPFFIPSPLGVNGSDDWVDNGDRMGVAAGAQGLAGFTASPTPGEAAIIVANGGRTLVNGFEYDSLDLCRVLDLVENEIVFLGGGGAGGQFRRGDCNTDGGVDISDAAFLLNFLFVFGPASTCDDACDSNDDGGVDISDAAYKLNFLFVPGSPPPLAPGATCGGDPTADSIDCATYPGCP